jgi:hypothetical protein
MSVDFKDPPLVFPTSDTEENGDSTSHDAEPVTGSNWTPEILQLLRNHGIDPEKLEGDEGEEDSDKPGQFEQFPTLLSFILLSMFS